MSSQPVFITRSDTLEAVCNEAVSVSCVALDTEFVREKTYYPIPALIQLYFSNQVYLIDPLKIENFSPFVKLLEDTNVVKIMHSCSEDLEVFEHMFGVFPNIIFDTQIAAALCGMDFSMSYQRLVEGLLKKDVDKSETRSNWLQRPLTIEQCNYAAHDVFWLLDLYAALRFELVSLGRENWCMQDCEWALKNARNALNEDQYYLKIRSIWKFKDEALNALKLLCEWREKVAKKENIPRGRVVTDAAIVEICESLPEIKVQLSKMQKLKSPSVRRYGDEILSLIETARSLQPLEEQSRLTLKGTKLYREIIRRMQKVIRNTADHLNMPTEILAKKRDLEAFIENKEGSLIYQSWRREFLEEDLTPLLEQMRF